MDGLNQVVHHDIVHTAMASLGSRRTIVGPQLMVILLEPCLRVVPTVGLRLALHIHMISIVHPEPLSALDAEA